MGFYDTKEGMDQYIKMARGFDGGELIDKLATYLPKGSSILEIGMGPGVDLDLLKENYRATGSDLSQLFLDRYRENHPDSDLLLLDGVTLETERSFQGIFSNKVLHHINYDQIRASFARQSEILEPKGVVMHSFWYGENIEEYEGLMFYQVTEEKVKDLVGDSFEILLIERYDEMEKGDSLLLVAQRRG